MGALPREGVELEVGVIAFWEDKVEGKFEDEEEVRGVEEVGFKIGIVFLESTPQSEKKSSSTPIPEPLSRPRTEFTVD